MEMQHSVAGLCQDKTQASHWNNIKYEGEEEEAERRINVLFYQV